MNGEGAIYLAVAVSASVMSLYGHRSQSPRASVSNRRERVSQTAWLLCSASAMLYIMFFVLWASFGISGRDRSGGAMIVLGILFAGYAFVAGLFAPGLERITVTLGAVSVVLLWLLAAAAGSVV